MRARGVRGGDGRADHGQPVHRRRHRSGGRGGGGRRRRLLGVIAEARTAGGPVVGHQRQRACAQPFANRAGQGQAERRATPRLTPRLQPPAVQPGVLDADRQAEPAAAAAPRPRLLGPPESVEHQRRLARPQPHPVVTDHDRNSLLVAGERDIDRPALAVVYRVRHEVAHDPLHPPRVDLRVHPDGQVQPQRRIRVVGEAADGFRRAGDDAVHVDAVRGQVGDTRVEAADLQQVGQQRLEPVQLGHEQLRAAPQRGQQLVLGCMQDVRRHPDGREGRAELVADVGGEAPLQRAELLELADLRLNAARHLVVGLGEARDLVVAPNGHPLVEVPVGEPFRDLRGLPHRAHDLAGDQARDPGQQHEEHEAADDQRALDEREGALLGVEREQQVELQVPACCAHGLADDQRRDVDALVGDRGVAARQRPLGDVPAQVRRDVRDGPGRHLVGPAVPRSRREHGAELPRRRRAGRVGHAGVRQQVQGVVQLTLRALPIRVHPGQVPFEQRAAGLGLAQGVDLLALQDPPGDLRLQHEAEHEDDGRREREGADDHPHLHRASPDRGDQRPDLEAEEAQLCDGAPHPAGERESFPPRPQPGDRARHGGADACPATAGGAVAARIGPGRQVTEGRPCTPRRGRSGPPPGAPGRARPWSAAAGRARSPDVCPRRAGSPTPARAAPRG